jgi:hypothetical protein
MPKQVVVLSAQSEQEADDKLEEILNEKLIPCGFKLIKLKTKQELKDLKDIPDNIKKVGEERFKRDKIVYLGVYKEDADD